MKIKSIISKQPPTLTNEMRNSNNKTNTVECQFQTKSGYSYSEKELDDFSNSIIAQNSPPAEEIKKYIKLNIDFVEIQSLKTNYELNQNKNSLSDQICRLFINFNELKRSYDKEITDFNTRINEFILKEEKLLQQMLEDHKIQQNKFNQKWSDPKFINSFYKKLSSKDQEKITQSNSKDEQSPELNSNTTEARNYTDESIQDEIRKIKEIELRDQISAQKAQINKFNENKFKYLEYIKMENQKRLKSISCSLNQVKSKSKFIVTSRNFLIEIEALNNQKEKASPNAFLSKSQYFNNKKSESTESKSNQKKTEIAQSKSQMAIFKNYSSTLNLEMSNVFKNNNNIVSTGKSTLPKISQGILPQRKNVFAIKQPLIKKPGLSMPLNKNLNVLNSAVKKPSPLKSINPFQIVKLGDLKEVDQITPENNNNKVDEIKQDKNQQSKNEKIQWVECDYQFHYNKKFRDNMFFIDYKKYKFSKKNPFTDDKKKVVYIK